MKSFKILIYTDSRGEHVPKNCDHTIYSKRIASDKRFDVTLVLCTMKWTTTLDFLEYMQEKNVQPYDYDLIILHTGIVEHSPRKKEDAYNLLYNNSNEKCNYKDFPKKDRIINSKKDIFDKIFGEKTISNHLNKGFDIVYDGSYTNNMYSLSMAEEKLIPILQKIPNLIWISSNKIVPNWNGNYFRKRPQNINLVEDYSKLFELKLPWVLNLNDWSYDDIKKYTCDNMHLSSEGSEYIYIELMKIIEKKYKFRNTLVVMGNGPSLKKVDIDDLRYFDCFGLNMAHRIYDKISFYPKYFGCFDFKVTDCHQKSYQQLIDTMPISRFFFIRNYFKGNKFTFVKLDRKKYNTFSKDTNIWDLGNSGANSCHVGISLGYKEIILVGVDCSYVDFIPECKKHNGGLIISETPTTNINYWFDDYQQKGDIYNIPNADIFHQPGWELLSKLSKNNNIKITNCSEDTTLKCFNNSTINKILTKKITLKSIRKIIFSKKIKTSINNQNKTSIIFNIKIVNPNILKNLKITLKWFMKEYGFINYNYYIIEQGTTPKYNLSLENINYVFLYNDKYFNRGWGFNTLAKHYINTKVMVFCDADLILNNPENLIKAIDLCKNHDIIVSPYKYVHFTTNKERTEIINGNIKNIILCSNNPVTVSGGIVVVNRKSFLKLGGFEEYTIYGGEDRSLDVLYLSFYNSKMIDGYGIHLFHPPNKNVKDPKILKMLNHLKRTYNCVYHKSLKSYENIHKLCVHTSKNTLKKHILNKLKYFGDINFYKSNRINYISGIPE